MATKSVSQPSASSASSQYQNNQTDTPPLGPRKTIFVLATVIGCIAILWPKIFYPMMFGGAEVPIKNTYINKDMKPGGKLIYSILFSMHSFTFLFWFKYWKTKQKTHLFWRKGCCGVVLDHEKYANVTQEAGQSGYRKRLNLMTGEISKIHVWKNVLLFICLIDKCYLQHMSIFKLF